MNSATTIVHALTPVPGANNPGERHAKAGTILQVFLDCLASGVTVFGPDLEMVACNARFKELLDLPEELFAEGLPSLRAFLRFNAMRGEYGPGDPEAIVAAALERTRKMKPHVFEHTRPNGVVLEVRGTPLPGGRFVAMYRDITQRKQAEEGLWHIAQHDHLTGLPNRRLFKDRLNQAVSLAKRNGGRFALLYFDLDEFKLVDDTLGRAAGDELLRSTATRVLQQVRESDTVARVRDDEFAVILPDLGRRQDVEPIVKKIVRVLTEPFELRNVGQSVVMGTNIGIAIYPADGEHANALVTAAETAMHGARRNGNH